MLILQGAGLGQGMPFLDVKDVEADVTDLQLHQPGAHRHALLNTAGQGLEGPVPGRFTVEVRLVPGDGVVVVVGLNGDVVQSYSHELSISNLAILVDSHATQCLKCRGGPKSFRRLGFPSREIILFKSDLFLTGFLAGKDGQSRV